VELRDAEHRQVVRTSYGAERFRSRADCEKGHVQMSDAGHWQVVRKAMRS